MLKLMCLSLVQSAFLTATQVFLKLSMTSLGDFSFSFEYFKKLICNWQMACSGICVAIATTLWLYIIKHFEFSIAYPMISISYIFGMLAAIFIFHESVSMVRWIGVLFIMFGVYLIVK